MSENVAVPKTIVDRLTGWLDRSEKGPTVEQMEAVTKERNDLAAKVAASEKEKAEAEARKKADELKVSMVAELKGEKYAKFSVPLEKVDESAEMLAGMTEEQRAWVLRNIAAASAQISVTKIGDENGSSGDGPPADPTAALNATIVAYASEHKVDYLSAQSALIREKPELFTAFKR